MACGEDTAIHFRQVNSTLCERPMYKILFKLFLVLGMNHAIIEKIYSEPRDVSTAKLLFRHSQQRDDAVEIMAEEVFSRARQFGVKKVDFKPESGNFLNVHFTPSVSYSEARLILDRAQVSLAYTEDIEPGNDIGFHTREVNRYYEKLVNMPEPDRGKFVSGILKSVNADDAEIVHYHMLPIRDYFYARPSTYSEPRIRSFLVLFNNPAIAKADMKPFVAAPHAQNLCSIKATLSPEGISKITKYSEKYPKRSIVLLVNTEAVSWPIKKPAEHLVFTIPVSNKDEFCRRLVASQNFKPIPLSFRIVKLSHAE